MQVLFDVSSFGNIAYQFEVSSESLLLKDVNRSVYFFVCFYVNLHINIYYIYNVTLNVCIVAELLDGKRYAVFFVRLGNEVGLGSYFRYSISHGHANSGKL